MLHRNNSVNLKPGVIIEPLLNMVTCTEQLRRHQPLLLSTCRVFYLYEQFDNFDRTMGFYWSYTLLLKPPVLMCSCMTQSEYGQNNTGTLVTFGESPTVVLRHQAPIRFSSTTRMDFLRQNLSPLFLFAHIRYVKQTSDKRHQHSDECNANKRVCLVHSIQSNPSTFH